ncbi:MAG TPA: prepilin-type N-terminal cleavage/methylation domain-containing protein [Nocardioides sp.]|uniref:competence type IV pilus major pilin ComGC n=1 Tax=Nocardioides sp. TaxID=35761 RepID=UPI002ED95410
MLRNSVSTLRKARKDEGFTLIELLIVIVILGVLAAIVVFSVRGISGTGEEAACKANVKSAQVAVEAHYAQEGSNPASLAALVPDFMKTDPSAAGVDPEVKVAYDSATGEVTPAAGAAC